MSAEIVNCSNQDTGLPVPDFVSRAQETLSTGYKSRLNNLTLRLRTASAATAAKYYEDYLTDLTQRKTRATAQIFVGTPAHLDINRFEVALIEAQEKEIKSMKSDSLALPQRDIAPPLAVRDSSSQTVFTFEAQGGRRPSSQQTRNVSFAPPRFNHQVALSYDHFSIHVPEDAEVDTHRWTPERLVEDEERVRDSLGRLTGQDLKTFLAQVLVPIQKEVLTELDRRKGDALSAFRDPSLASDDCLLDHADRLRRFRKSAEDTLQKTPSDAASTSAPSDRGNSPPPSSPPSSGDGQRIEMARRSRPTEERWVLAKMLERGNDLQEAVTDTVSFTQSNNNPTFLKHLLEDELVPERTNVERELDRRRASYGSEFNQEIFVEREFHLLEHAKVMSQLVSRVQEEITSLETVAAPSHSSHRPDSIPTIAMMIKIRNTIRYNLLEGGTATEFIRFALSGVERALAAEPNNAFYKDEIKQLLAFQAENQRRQNLENLQTEEIRVAAAERESATTPQSFSERLTGVFSRVRLSLTDSFTRAANALNSFGRMSATVAKFASIAALGVSLRGAAGSPPSYIEEKLSQPSVAEVPAESRSTLNGIFSSTNQKLMRGLSALRAGRSPQEDSYAKKSEERTHEPG